MYNYNEDTPAPWYVNRSVITNVVIEGDVTSIGNYAFYGLYKLTSVNWI